jgi:hypothetical protein
MLADGHVDGHNLICGVHIWDYRVDTGISEYANDEKLPKFASWIEDGDILVDSDEIHEWELKNPQPYDREGYLGQYADLHGTPDEPHNDYIRDLAKDGLASGEHGPIAAMGVPGHKLPLWRRYPVRNRPARKGPAARRCACRYRDRHRTQRQEAAKTRHSAVRF